MEQKRKNIFMKLFGQKKPSVLEVSKKEHIATRKQKIETGAKDFATRFEGVMRELSNG